jgi:hypothetical protein
MRAMFYEMHCEVSELDLHKSLDRHTLNYGPGWPAQSHGGVGERAMNTHRSKVTPGERGMSGASVPHPALEYLPDRIPAAAELEQGGFAGTCDTSLTDWIQLVQMSRRDAVLSVRTHDGRECTLWCRQGDIIDAVCDGLDGAAAVYRALSWQGGKVSVEFRAFDHRRQIDTPTAGLLLEAAYLKDTGADDLADTGTDHVFSTEIVPVEPPPPGTPVRTSVAALQSELPAQRQRAEWPKVLPLLRRHRPLIVLLGGAGGLSVLMLLWGVVSKSTPPVADRVFEPPAIHDSPPPQPATHPQTGDGITVVALPRAPDSLPVRKPNFTIEARGTLARHRAAGAPLKRSGGTWSRIASASIPGRSRGPTSFTMDTVKERAPRIQMIEERSPHIQIIDEPTPRIEVIQ